MAYMNQKEKALIAAELKKVVPAGWKYSLSVYHHSTICMTISAAPVDLLAESNRVTKKLADRRNDLFQENTSGYLDFNQFHPEASFDDSLPVFVQIFKALNLNNYNNSDSQSDYFDVGHYVSISIGKYDKPFTFTPSKSVGLGFTQNKKR
jgi:hypothetical protein